MLAHQVNPNPFTVCSIPEPASTAKTPNIGHLFMHVLNIPWKNPSIFYRAIRTVSLGVHPINTDQLVGTTRTLGTNPITNQGLCFLIRILQGLVVL
jgi:hypothetical protein